MRIRSVNNEAAVVAVHAFTLQHKVSAWLASRRLSCFARPAWTRPLLAWSARPAHVRPFLNMYLNHLDLSAAGMQQCSQCLGQYAQVACRRRVLQAFPWLSLPGPARTVLRR